MRGEDEREREREWWLGFFNGRGKEGGLEIVECRERGTETPLLLQKRMLGKSVCTFISCIFPGRLVCMRQGSAPGAALTSTFHCHFVGEAARWQT